MDSDVFDRSLPPVDRGSWLEHQRRRAEQYARERIAASGAFAGQGGDWLQRASQRIDGLQGPFAGGVGPTPGSIGERAPTAPPGGVTAPRPPGVPALPTGPELRALMDVAYQGPLSVAPQNMVPGQEAVDLGPSGQPGYARTVYPGGRTIDWRLPG